MIIINVVLHAATVVLNSSVSIRGVCPGEMVTYTCTVIQGIGLDWIVEPFISGSTRIRFVLGSTPLGRRVDCNCNLHSVITLTLWPPLQILPTP